MFNKKKLEVFFAKADKFIIFNDDPDLERIKVYLPKPPPLEFIDGYDMPTIHQKFKRVEIPQKLNELIKSHSDIDELWTTLDKQRVKYKDEINWIKLQWYYRLNGYWFMCKGKPTYITGVNYFYLNYFKLNKGYPTYRDRDRKFFIFEEFSFNDTKTFKNLRYDEKGEQIPNRYGDELIDLGRRVCAGFLYPKHRREGATYKTQCTNLEIITRMINVISGIQSKSDDDAEEVFLTKTLKPFLALPFFFKPKQKGKTDTQSGLFFDAPVERVKGGNLSIEDGLGSSITFRSSDEGAYDGWDLIFYHEDEIGKSPKIDVQNRHDVVMQCLAEKNGLELKGWGIGTSTVEEMTTGGGETFFNLATDSNYYLRSEEGLTKSFYYNCFIPATEGFIIDEYGYSLIDKSKEFLENQANMHLKKGDVEKWAKHKRRYPIRYADCFIQTGGNIGFDQYILETRISELRFSKDKAIYGDLYREDENIKTSKVRFRNNPNGRFCISRVLTENESNRYHFNGKNYIPDRDIVNVGVDAFKFGQDGISDGGIIAKYRRDFDVDPVDKPISEWESDRIILSYRNRTDTTDEFCDDALKACQYFGGWCNPETNVAVILDYFERHGFKGFLKILKKANGDWQTRAGIHLGETEKQEGFNLIRDSIRRRGAYEKHLDVLEEAKAIMTPKELTKFDELAAWSMALQGEKINYDDIFKKPQETKNIKVVRRKNYSRSRY